uniref:U1-type domain-containing protein n=1 Tax=Romanomermis culicivorax TaxID=13658 RepID=A0A915HL82_ROMCU
MAVGSWIASVPNNSSKAWCRYCKRELNPRLSDLKDHAKTQTHRQAVAHAANFGNCLITNHAKAPVPDVQKVAELRLASFIADSSIAFRQSDMLISLIQTLFKKDEVAKKMRVPKN